MRKINYIILLFFLYNLVMKYSHDQARINDICFFTFKQGHAIIQNNYLSFYRAISFIFFSFFSLLFSCSCLIFLLIVVATFLHSIDVISVHLIEK